MFGKKSNVIGIALSAICLWLVFRKVQWAQLQEALNQLQLGWLIFAVAVFLLTFIVRTLRWKTLLNPAKRIPYLHLFSVIFIGYMANNILPARLGEFVRAYVLSQKQGVRKSTTLATIFIERIFDGLSLLALLGALMLLYASNTLHQEHAFPHWVEVSGWISGVVFVAAFAFLVALEHAPQFADRLNGLIRVLAKPTVATRLEGILGAFVEGVACLRSFRRLVAVFGLSTLVWLIEATTYLLVGKAFDLQLGFDVFLVTMVIVNLGTIVPSAPGFVGTFQAFCILSLGLYGVAHETGLAYGLVLNIAEYLPVTALGLCFLVKEHLGLKAILKGEEPEQVRLSESTNTLDAVH